MNIDRKEFLPLSKIHKEKKVPPSSTKNSKDFDSMKKKEEPPMTKKKKVPLSALLKCPYLFSSSSVNANYLLTLHSASNQPSVVLKDLHLGEVEKVKTTLFPMVHKVQDDIVLIPHIDFVIPNEFDEVKFKVFLFSMLPKVIPDLKLVLLINILLLQCFKTRGRVFSNQRRMMQETLEDYYLVLFMFASQLYFYVLGPNSLLGY